MAEKRKYVVLLGDGMADRPLEELGGRTPLEAAETPNMDRMAAHGTVGLARTIPEGMALGSDVANLSVLGYDPATVYTGRSPIEAAGMGVDLGPDDVAFRCNLVTLGLPGDDIPNTDLPRGDVDPGWIMVDFAGGHPDNTEAASFLKTLAGSLSGNGIEFHPGVSYRHLVVWKNGLDSLETAPPHDLTDQPIGNGWPRGEAAATVLDLMRRSVKVLPDNPVNRMRVRSGVNPVNAIWLWGQGKRPRIAPFRERYGIDGVMITAVDLLRGLGASIGFSVVDVAGATGYLDTDYAGKASAALSAIENVDLVYIHVEAPDEASHGGSLENKIRALEDFDAMVVGPVLEGLQSMGKPFRALVMPDHATPIAIKTHSGEPVPFAILDSENSGSGAGVTFSERDAKSTGLLLERGYELMGRFIEGTL